VSELPVAPDETTRRNLEAVARHLARTPAPPAAVSSRWRWLGPVGLVLAFALGKLKLLLPLLKFAKLGTLLTMVVSVWVYATQWGFPFALGFVLLIFVHELGHVLVLRHQGIPAGAPVFIPFVGAFIAMRGRPRDAYVEALVGIGGPVLGSAAAFACLAVGWATGSLFWHALAFSGLMLNLFNLIPISPLDGGRIVGVVSRWLWVVGYVLGIAAWLATRSPLLLIILVLGLFQVRSSLRSTDPSYYAVPAARRVAVGLAYFALAAILALGMWAADQPLQTLAP
jgi:Zn-dependent protease